jgi:hypothetical protein
MAAAKILSTTGYRTENGGQKLAKCFLITLLATVR